MLCLFAVQLSLRPDAHSSWCGHWITVLYCPTMVDPRILICLDFSCTAANFLRTSFMLTTAMLKTLNSPVVFKYTFPRDFVMYALWIHIQGLLVVWAETHRYKVSKPKLFYFTYGKRNKNAVSKKEKSLHVFPCLCFFPDLGVLWLWSGCSKGFYGFIFRSLFLINLKKKFYILPNPVLLLIPITLLKGFVL